MVRNREKAWLAVILLLCATALGWYEWRMLSSLAPVPPAKPSPRTARPVPRPPGDALQARGAVRVPLNDMIELNFKKRSEIYDIRRQFVNRMPALVKAAGLQGYEPSSDVFGQIVDGRPWWGILGISHYAKGPRSIEGPAEESRFIANPWLFVGLMENYAHRVEGSGLPPVAFYPRPLSLTWAPDASYGWVKYDVTSYFRDTLSRRYPEALDRKLYMVLYNARDLGYRWVALSDTLSQGTSCSLSEKSRAWSIPQFIHCGGSCGYPGGCNNMSPSNPELVVKFTRQPARMVFKLWWDEPLTASADPDLWFVVETI